MGKIIINDIRLFANHGCLEEEGKIGSAYSVEVIVKANLSKSAKTDNLSDTVDYVHINKIVKEEMAIRSALLEHVANRMVTRILSEIPIIRKATVKVSKINPPIGGNVADVTIVMSKKQKVKK
jgi:dihydroneopterin aldolase